jgi:putative ABC transport system permease protein
MSFNGSQVEGKKISVNIMDADSAALSVLQPHWKLPAADGPRPSALPFAVLNESAVRALGLPADPRGLPLYIDGKEPQMQIAGVVSDFAYSTLAGKTGPLIITDAFTMHLKWVNGCYMLARMDPRKDLPSLLASMKKVYDQYPSTHPFTYLFADESYNKLYQAVDRLAGLIGIFALLSILIACMGLFGLATFATLQRTREIGIRKVLGAEVSRIMSLLTVDFLKLVLLAVLLAMPLSWWLMNGWLEQYANRIQVGPWLMTGAGIGVVALALLTVGFLALKAARANPVESLRSE